MQPLKQFTMTIPSQYTMDSQNQGLIPQLLKHEPVLTTEKSGETGTKKTFRLESLIEATSNIQKTILEKIIEMRDEVSTVK